MTGADMVVYLLEKSRLTYQQPLERCYHSFYNLMSDAVPDLKEKCLLSNDIRDYHYVSQGKFVIRLIILFVYNYHDFRKDHSAQH